MYIHLYWNSSKDKTVWKIEIQSKRTGFNPKGNWAASGASAAAFEANDTFDDDL